MRMTGKERVRAVLNHETVDRIAFVPCIDPYFRSGLPSPYKTMDIYELQALCGTDLLRGVSCHKSGFDETVQHIHQQDSDGAIIDIYKTPCGELREIHKFTAQSPYIPFPTEYLIKTIDDLKIYRYLLKHIMNEPDYDAFRFISEKFNHLMVSCSVEDSAFRQLLTKKIGLENFVYFFYDNPDEIEETLKHLQFHFCSLLEIAAQGPSEVFICYENTNTANSSMDWFETYELPQLNSYADIVHKHGKKLLVHMCGRINLIIESIAKARFDGIIDVSPPPTGDLILSDAVKMMANYGKVIAGGIDCNAFVFLDLVKFEKKVISLLQQIPDSSNFMLCSGDAVPQGAKIENFEIIGKILSDQRYKTIK
jgi:hypothetical protein